MLLECILAVAIVGAAVEEDVDVLAPKQVDVMPVFFVPQGEAAPTAQQKQKLAKHIAWTQRWYREALGDRDTFRIATPDPDVYAAKRTLEFYKQQSAQAEAVSYSSHFVGELLARYGVNRFQCPYVFAIVVMNPREDFPIGGGRTINGGFNRGGGMLNMSSYALDRLPIFQSTLRHELGHGFGLPHVDVYGKDMKTTPSMMAYNTAYWTRGFEEPATPARFIAEDVRGLSLNPRCFAELKFDPARDNPEDRALSRIVWLGPMEIVDQPSYAIQVTTTSGSTHQTKPENVVQREILPSKGPGVTFDAARMWSSDVAPSGWVTLEVTFPVPVTLTKVALYTQHSGKYHPAVRARIQAQTPGAEKYRDLVQRDLKSVDAALSMQPTRAAKWRIHLRAGPSNIVVVRGLRFANESGEIFPPAVPFGRQ